MQHDRIAFEKRWVVLSQLPLEEVCERLRAAFGLPNFALESEIDSRWGISEKQDAEVNVTHWAASAGERLEELPSGFPDYNYLVIITVASECLDQQGEHWFLDSTIMSVSRRLADVFGETVYYLETAWAERPPRFVVAQPTSDHGTATGPR